MKYNKTISKFINGYLHLLDDRLKDINIERFEIFENSGFYVVSIMSRIDGYNLSYATYIVMINDGVVMGSLSTKEPHKHESLKEAEVVMTLMNNMMKMTKHINIIFNKVKNSDNSSTCNIPWISDEDFDSYDDTYA